MHDEELVKSVYDKIKQLNLETVALLFLEMHKPLNTLFYNSTIFFQPFVAPLLSPQRYKKLQLLLENKENVDVLVTMLKTK